MACAHESPYRASDEQPDDAARESSPDAELLPVFALFWLWSLTRVVLGFVWHETFGGELSLALFAVVLVPVLVKRPIAQLVARRRSA